MLCHKINWRLLPVKCHYFLFFAAIGCTLPYRTVFAKRLGISATAIGVIFSVVPFIKILTNPLFGFILDYFKRYRLILSTTMSFLALSHIALIFVPHKSSMIQDEINTIEKNVHSHLTYIWTNDSFQSSCHPKLKLNIEYSQTQELINGTNNFICDMQCYKPRNDISLSRTENESHYHIEMNSQFKIFIHISHCDISVKIGKGQLVVFHTGVKHLLLFEVNDGLKRNVVSYVSPSNNCSSEAQDEAVSSKNIHYNDKKLNHKKQTKMNHKNILELAIENINTELPNILRNGLKKYYVQNEYIINFYNKKFCLNFCSQEFDCDTKKCSRSAEEMGNNLGEPIVEENEFLSLQFWCFFVFMIVSSTTLSAICFLMDAVCHELLQGKKEKYGHQRVWGSFGWGVGALAGGFLNQILSSDSEAINYAPSFYCLSILAIIDFIPLYHLKVSDIKYSAHIWKDVCFLFSKMDILYNIFIVYAMGALSGFIWNYQFWFMEEIGSSQVLLGLSQTVECIFEVPCFLVSGWIIKQIGHNHINSISLLCFGLRYLSFAVMYDPWWSLAAGLFNGPSYGVFYASMTTYAKTEAPSGTEATVQSLLHLCFEGLGAATGSLLGGVGLDKFGCRRSFTYAAEISFILLFVNVLVSVYLSKRERHIQQIQAASMKVNGLK